MIDGMLGIIDQVQGAIFETPSSRRYTNSA